MRCDRLKLADELSGKWMTEPRGADRTWFLAVVTPKEIFPRVRQRLVAIFGVGMLKIGAQKLAADSQKPSIGGRF